MEIQKAMEEDPTVFEYDSIYDDMEQNKQEKERILKTKQRDSKVLHLKVFMGRQGVGSEGGRAVEESL